MEEVNDIQKKEPTTGGVIGVLVAGVLLGYVLTFMFGSWSSDAMFVLVGGVVSIFTTLFLWVGYYMSLEQENKKAQDARSAEAATEYLRQAKK